MAGIEARYVQDERRVRCCVVAANRRKATVNEEWLLLEAAVRMADRNVSSVSPSSVGRRISTSAPLADARRANSS
eukprot:CAMPEP_0115885608 /NCGR_PEP_ID=MMETSP0287-20121206/30765_1 /TAXON_ID=412157 /ORGANISM="Chrysochromulina rotalis, Strain UIO044" /LENGTH=74 /DNA_ID=CAMNT_0003342037 /DNA_START=454 /DNA_END=675 /DNA_ORIENTATION=+